MWLDLLLLSIAAVGWGYAVWMTGERDLWQRRATYWMRLYDEEAARAQRLALTRPAPFRDPEGARLIPFQGKINQGEKK